MNVEIYFYTPIVYANYKASEALKKNLFKTKFSYHINLTESLNYFNDALK